MTEFKEDTIEALEEAAPKSIEKPRKKPAPKKNPNSKK